MDRNIDQDIPGNPCLQSYMKMSTYILVEMRQNENTFWEFFTLMSFDLSHLVFWYLQSWIPYSTEFSECLKFAQVIVWLSLSRRNFVPLHLIPIQILQKLVFSVTVQYLDQLPTMELVFLLGSNKLWLSLLSIGKKQLNFVLSFFHS